MYHDVPCTIGTIIQTLGNRHSPQTLLVLKLGSRKFSCPSWIGSRALEDGRDDSARDVQWMVPQGWCISSTKWGAKEHRNPQKSQGSEGFPFFRISVGGYLQISLTSARPQKEIASSKYWVENTRMSISWLEVHWQALAAASGTFQDYLGIVRQDSPSFSQKLSQQNPWNWEFGILVSILEDHPR